MGQRFYANETSLLNEQSVKQGKLYTVLKLLELLASLVEYGVSGDLKGASIGNSVLVMKTTINVGQHHSGISSFTLQNVWLRSFSSEADLFLRPMKKPPDLEQVMHPPDTILWIRSIIKKTQRRDTL